jgi:hypothetical protein
MKNKLIAALILGSVAGYAAFQYEMVVGPSNSIWPGVAGNPYFVRVTEGSGTLYLQDHINTLWSANQSESILNNVSAFGYINLTTGQSGAGTFDSPIITYQHAMNQWNDVVTQYAYQIGSFSAGDEVAIWVTDKSGNTGSSVGNYDSAFNDSGLGWRTWGAETDILGNTAGHLSFTGVGGNSVFFGITGVEGGGPSTGVPLPGVFSALSVGGLVGCVKLLGKKKKALLKTA